MTRPFAEFKKLFTPNRTRIQFRLPTLFVLVVITAVPCFLFKSKMDRKQKERAAVAEIKRLGAVIYFEWQIDEKTEPFGAAWLRRALGDDFFSRVKWVVTNPNGDITDDSLVNLAPLADLELVALSGAKQITGNGLVHVRGLTHLKCLLLDDTSVTDASLSNLKELTGLLKLNLYNTDVTDAGMVHLRRMLGLQELIIRNTNVSAAGVAELQKALPKCKIIR